MLIIKSKYTNVDFFFFLLKNYLLGEMLRI